MNKHTAFGLLVLILGCFWAGYFVGTRAQYSVSREKIIQRGEQMFKYDTGGRFNPDDLTN